jgi:hypothetical protein
MLSVRTAAPQGQIGMIAGKGLLAWYGCVYTERIVTTAIVTGHNSDIHDSLLYTNTKDIE